MPPEPPTPDAATSPKPHTLDDLMIAMDVVDTLRHRKDLVSREFDEAGREQELVGRLKEIYRGQGIEVPDAVLAEGVKALRERRFVYTPPPPSLKRLLLTAWAHRGAYATTAAIVLVLLGGASTYQYISVTRPAYEAEQRARMEVTETLPNAIRQVHADIVALGREPAVKERADALLVDGERAIRDRDRAALTDMATKLTELRTEVAREYTLTIVSRPGETSGVWRVPKVNPDQRNYYLIVEPIGSDGRRTATVVRNEETGALERVEKYGVRVPKEVFDAVAADKRDDGIIQNNRFGVKRRGMLGVEYAMPYAGGTITRW